MPKNTRQTSSAVALIASKLLRHPKSAKTIKSVAASALSQTKRK